MKPVYRLIMLCVHLLLLHVLIGATPAAAFHMYGGYYGFCCASEAYIPPEEDPDTAAELVIPPSLTYEVQPRDTMYSISRSFGITVQTLLAANPTVEPNRLAIGQLLQIPAAEVGLQLPDGQINTVSLVLTSTLSAYTAGVESTGKTPSHPAYGVTSSGSKAEEGRTIAVDPSIIPFGTTVFIDGIGIRTAEDTGSAIRGSRIDIFMDDVREARQFGVKKNVKVYVLGKDAVRTAS
ncbi:MULTISPECIES: 3D domain-containing protein [unclassified Paenibacillus]|uniref:3D domain-containing protein n=1 Tax=unclassified Paenibacillus TaxID=185978 RepID=UPI001AE10E14|nr:MULTISPECIES: 3D domain-containing protein [unclassified Paenibacillus]MBP1156865.1 3D (Asp-Asp-Asp) domain-containing protein [Paenibacillus sp. PvP091]MBP1172396.1 3D (Asp-Asp-Asp) domain-containing protein [Paenibacillus sp. PvR098]MBP2438777.1 3D (Asp-Asp-Asp) domain-containing protein [Paenibacillus sp. PvP052]